MDPTAQALLGLQQYPSDDPVNGIVPPTPNPAHITPAQWQVMQQVGQPFADAGSAAMKAIMSDPVVRYQTAAHQAVGSVIGDKLKSAWDTLTYPMHNQMPPSFADQSDPRTQGAIANAAGVAQRLISPAGAFRPRPGVVGSGMGGMGPSEPPGDIVGPLMQKAPWQTPSVDPAGILAYHGSPHDFPAFDLSKIGTGEGAQVYGHGMYTAGREGVARSYREALAGRPEPWSMKYGNSDIWKTLNRDEVPDNIRRGAIELHGRLSNYRNPEQMLPRVQNELEQTLKNHTEGKINPIEPYRLDDMRAALSTLKDPNFKVTPGSIPGHMYEVNIKHDPEHMLDWDKPINEQPAVFNKLREQGWITDHEVEMRKEWAARTKNDRPEDALLDWYRDLEGQKITALKADDRAGEKAVQKKIDVIMNWWNQQIASNGKRIDPTTYPTGEQFYQHMTDQHDTPAGASAALKDMGIPGIRYFDQGSRGVGEGSRNYVSFDDKAMEILRKYGIAGLLSAGTAGGAAVNNLRNYIGGKEDENKQMLQLLQHGGT